MSLDNEQRRQLLKSLGVAGAGTLAGCLGGGGGGGDGGDGAGGTTQPSGDQGTPEPTATPTAQFKGETLYVITWTGYQALREMLARETGAKAKYKVITSDVQSFNTLKGGGTNQFHLVIFNNDWALRFAKAGVTQPLDLQDYPSRDKWLDKFKGVDIFVYNDQQYAVPIRWGWGGLGYNSNEVDLEVLQEKGYSAVWDPEFKGDVVVSNWPTWVIPLVLMGLGYEPYKEHPQSVLEELKQTLVKMFQNVSAVHSGASAIRQDFLNENAILSIGVGNYALSQLTFEGYTQFKLMIPPDARGWFWLGGVSHVDNPNLNEALANKYINLALSPEGQYRICHADAPSKGCPVNKAAYDKFSEEVQRKILMFKDKTFEGGLTDVINRCVAYQVSPQQDKWLNIWEEAKATVGT